MTTTNIILSGIGILCIIIYGILFLLHEGSKYEKECENEMSNPNNTNMFTHSDKINILKDNNQYGPKLPTRTYMINILLYISKEDCFIVQLIPIKTNRKEIDLNTVPKMIIHKYDNRGNISPTYKHLKDVCEVLWNNPSQYRGIIDEELFVYRERERESIKFNSFCNN